MSSELNHGREFTFIWKIQNYSSSNYELGEKFDSPKYIAESLYRTRWYLRLYPKGYSEDYKNYIGLFLDRDDDKVDFNEFKRRIPLNIKLEILNPQGDSLHSWETKDLFDAGVSTGRRNFMLANELMDKFENWDEDTLTIRCHMSKEPKLRLRNQCEIHTKINVIRSCYTWHVNKIESLALVEKTTFFLFDSSNFEITLTSVFDKLKIRIYKTDTRRLPSQSVTCKISLLNTDGEKRYAKVDKHNFNQKLNWEFPDFITKSELGNEVNKFLKNGMFTLVFEFTCSNGMVPISLEEYTYNYSSDVPSFDDAFSALQKDLGNMLNDEKYCDVKIRADNELMSAHKAILAARSQVLSVMFNQNMLENETGIVDIPDLDKHSLKLFWEFIYTGNLNSTDTEIILNLFMVADRFQIISLKEKCSSLLMTKLSNKNVCEIFKIADMLGHSLLKESALNFILSNACNILSSPEWSHWVETDSKLTSEILSKMSIHFGSTLNKTLGNAVQLQNSTSLTTAKNAAENINQETYLSLGASAKNSSRRFTRTSNRNSSREPTQKSGFTFGTFPQKSGFTFGTFPQKYELTTQNCGPSTLNSGTSNQNSPREPTLKSGLTFGTFPQKYELTTQNCGPSTLNSGPTTPPLGQTVLNSGSSTTNSESSALNTGSFSLNSGLSTESSEFSAKSTESFMQCSGLTIECSGLSMLQFGSSDRSSGPSTQSSELTNRSSKPTTQSSEPTTQSSGPSALNFEPSTQNI